MTVSIKCPHDIFFYNHNHFQTLNCKSKFVYCLQRLPLSTYSNKIINDQKKLAWKDIFGSIEVK